MVNVMSGKYLFDIGDFDDEVKGVRVYSDNFPFTDKIDCKPDDISDEVSEFSEKLSVDEEILYDILSPLFSSDDYNEWLNDKDFFYEVEKEKFEDGDSVSEEENEENETDIEELEQKLEEFKEKLENKEEKLNEYRDKVEKYEEEQRQNVIDNIIETRKSKEFYSEDEEIEKDREELSEYNRDVLDQILKESKKFSLETNKKAESKVKETKKDFKQFENSEENKMKELEKKMFGSNKVYK